MRELLQLGANPLIHNRQAASLTVGIRPAVIYVVLWTNGDQTGEQHVVEATRR